MPHQQSSNALSSFLGPVTGTGELLGRHPEKISIAHLFPFLYINTAFFSTSVLACLQAYIRRLIDHLLDLKWAR